MKKHRGKFLSIMLGVNLGTMFIGVGDAFKELGKLIFSGNGFYPYELFITSYPVLSIMISVIAFWGIFSWKKWGIYTYIAFSIVDLLVSPFVYLNSKEVTLPPFLVAIVISLSINTMTLWAVYRKRYLFV